MAIVGMGVTAWRRQNKKASLLVFAFVVFLLTITVPSLYWNRWIIPVIPLGLLFGARAVWLGIDGLVNYRPHLARASKLGAALLIVLLSAMPLKETMQQAYLLTRPDTRTLATEWIIAHVPAGSKIVRERYTGFIPDDDFSVTFSYYLYDLGPYEPRLNGQYDYFVASSYAYGRFFAAGDLSREQVTFYERLFDDELVAEFEPDAWQRPGPTIRIFQAANDQP